MNRLPLPAAVRLRSLLAYNKQTGALTWKTGPRKGQRADMGGWSRYRRVSLDGKRYQAHRIIWLMQTGEQPRKGEIDHKDGNGHNNAWRNLRDATRSQNNMNTGAHRDNTAGLKWVRTKAPGRYQATVQLTLGTFKTAMQAHLRARAFMRVHNREFFNDGATNAR